MRRRDIRLRPHPPSRCCKREDKATTRPLGGHQVLGARTYFNQPRTISQVKQPTVSGTIPTSKFLPNQGSLTISASAIRLNEPLVKIQPACKPIGNQSERVRIRASARIQPIKKSVVTLAVTRIGSAN